MKEGLKGSSSDQTYPRYWILVTPVIALAVMAVILFSHSRPPLFADYPEWTYQGVLLRNCLHGHSDAAYLLKNYPIPNSLTTVGLGCLMLFMPWQAASKLWLLIEVVLGLWCAMRLQRASGYRQSWPLIVVSAGALLGVNLWYGFTNFQFGTYFAMLFGALLVDGFRSRWIYGALLVLMFFTHMIPFAFGVCMLFLYAQQYERLAMLWQTVPSLVLSLWYFIGRLTHANIDSNAGMQSSVPYFSLAFVAFRINTCLKCWGFVNSVAASYDSVLLRLVGPWLFAIFFGISATIGVVVIVLAATTTRASIVRGHRLRFFWMSVALFFVAGLFMPGAAAGISDPGARMVQVSIWSAVCVLMTPSRWINGALSCCAIALIGLNLYQMAVVAERPPMEGISDGPLPARLREFDHVEYSAKGIYYDKIDQGRLDAPIFPTAMFVNRPRP